MNIGDIVYKSSRLDLCPLYKTMTSTKMPVDHDSEGNIILNDVLELANHNDIAAYMRFIDTGDINRYDAFNIELYSYMGHNVNREHVNYTKIRLMERWATSTGIYNIITITSKDIVPQYSDVDCAVSTSIYRRELAVTNYADAQRAMSLYPNHVVVVVGSLGEFVQLSHSGIIFYRGIYYTSLISEYKRDPSNKFSYILELFNELVTWEFDKTNKSYTITWSDRIPMLICGTCVDYPLDNEYNILIALQGQEAGSLVITS